MNASGSPYAGLYRAYSNMERTMRAGEPGPERVSAVVVEALGARRPKARYLAAVPFGARLLMGMGDSLKDRFFELSIRTAAK
jgi:hypothetical protein